MHSNNHFFIEDAVMLVIKPIAVENVDVSHHFLDWNPEALKLAIVIKDIIVDMYP